MPKSLDKKQISEMLKAKPSISEEHGLALLEDSDLMVFCPGISTAGISEAKMASLNPARRIIATTIDEAGLTRAQRAISKIRLDSKIEMWLEDLRAPNYYPDNYFDFIYARLVLHYLSAQELDKVLADLYRTIKPGKKLFIVVRSLQNILNEEFTTDPVTRLNTVRYYNPDGSFRYEETRFFHTVESIYTHLVKAGFVVNSLDSFSEQLYVGFSRKIIAPKVDHLIEIVGMKK